MIMAKTVGNEDLVVVANVEYWQSASIRSEKSSSAVHDVELTRTLKFSASGDAKDNISGSDLITPFRTCPSVIGFR